MTVVGILEARASFAKLGNTVTITRRGKPVADLEAFAERHTLGGIDWRELRDEGRR